MSAPAGAINAWKCEECGGLTVARHVDDGVTPMMLACRASGEVGECRGTAWSSGYPSEPVPERILNRLEWEWYKPGLLELQAMPSEMRTHIMRGGLALRRIGESN